MPTSPSDKVRIAITLGDPAGIGPEVTLKALSRLQKIKSSTIILLLGKAHFFKNLSRKLSLNLRFKDVSEPTAIVAAGTLPCYFPSHLPAAVERGRSKISLTKAAVQSIALAVKLAMEKKIDAIVTPPINKAALKKAGFAMLGHTEYLAKLSHTKKYEMMLVGGKLRVVLVTRHMAIKDVPSSIRARRVEETLALTDQELKKSFGIKKPRIVVCGLNPHAGEEGSFGNEEILQITPAVQAYRKKTDSEIVGPLSPDALFHDAYVGRYDAEICMYHDQGLIPLKMISRGFGVNITLGLPFVRTSPDHGTGYDIAKYLKADSGSMLQAIKFAVFLHKNRQKYERSHRSH